MHISSVPVTFCGSLKVLVTWNNVKYKLLKYDSHIILNDIDSKHSSNRSFRSHYSYPQVTVFCTLLAVTFFPSKQFFLHFFNLKQIICTLKLCNEDIGHQSCLRENEDLFLCRAQLDGNIFG